MISPIRDEFGLLIRENLSPEQEAFLSNELGISRNRREYWPGCAPDSGCSTCDRGNALGFGEGREEYERRRAAQAEYRNDYDDDDEDYDDDYVEDEGTPESDREDRF